MSKGSLSLIFIFQMLRLYESELSLAPGPFIMTAEVGKTVELTSHYFYEVKSVSLYFWYKQRVGEAPILIDTHSCQWGNCKFISKEGKNKHQLILEIRNVQKNDWGSYYSAHRSSNAPLHNGSTLLVGDSSTNKTAVLVFVPPGELHLRETVPLVCLVSGVSSNQVVIFWNISDLVTEGPSDPGMKEADGTYSVRSHVIVSRETWRSGGVCTCVVQLGSPGKYWTKSLPFSKAAESWGGWCMLALPVIITVLVILVLLLVFISIWIHKSGRSGEPSKRSHNETVSLRERRQREGKNERQTDDRRQRDGKRTHRDAVQTQSGPLYASLDLAALEKRSKKKGDGR